MGKQGKMQKQRRQHAEMREREAAVAAAEAAAEMKMEAAVEAVVQEQERKAEAAAALQARNEKKERDEESRGRAEAGQGGSGEASVRRAVEVLAGKIEEMRVVAEQREQRSQMIYEDMNEAVGDVSYDTRAVGRSLGRLQLPRVEHGLCLRALERMGQQWEQQAAKMAGAVEQMRDLELKRNFDSRVRFRCSGPQMSRVGCHHGVEICILLHGASPSACCFL